MRMPTPRPSRRGRERTRARYSGSISLPQTLAAAAGLMIWLMVSSFAGFWKAGCHCSVSLSRNARGDVGELAEQRVDDERQDHDVGHHEFARRVGHVADARRCGHGFGDDQRQPHDAEREAQADEDRGQRAGEDHLAEQRPAAHAVDAAHLDQLRIDGAHAVQRVEVDREEHAERGEEELCLLADAEPQDDQRDQRQVGDGAQHLQRRVGQPVREAARRRWRGRAGSRSSRRRAGPRAPAAR